jgi:hypothetical protein
MAELANRVLCMLICILNATIVDFMTRRLLQRRIYRLFIAVRTVVITGNGCNRFEIDPIWAQSGFKLNRINLNRSQSIYMWTRSNIYIDYSKNNVPLKRCAHTGVKPLCAQIGSISNRLQPFPVITTVLTAHLIRSRIDSIFCCLPGTCHQQTSHQRKIDRNRSNLRPIKYVV